VVYLLHGECHGFCNAIKHPPKDFLGGCPLTITLVEFFDGNGFVVWCTIVTGCKYFVDSMEDCSGEVECLRL